MISMIPSERSTNNTKRLFPEMKQGKVNFVQGEDEKGQLRMTKKTTKTLAQGGKGRDRRLVVLDRHQLKFLRRGFHGLMPRLIKPLATMYPLDALPWRSVRILWHTNN